MVLTIGMSRAVNMAVVALSCLVLDMRRVNGDSTGLFLRCLVDLVVVSELCTTLFRKNFGDGSSQSSFAVVDVTYQNRGEEREEWVDRKDRPMVPMLIWGFFRENSSAYPL